MILELSSFVIIQCAWLISDSNSSTRAFCDCVVLVMELIKFYGRELVTSFTTKLNHHVTDVYGKLSGLVGVILVKYPGHDLGHKFHVQLAVRGLHE